MVKRITKIGNSQGLVFDSTLMQMARLKVGDEINVEIHDSGAITITPLGKDRIDEDTAATTARRLIGKNSELFRRLS